MAKEPTIYQPKYILFNPELFSKGLNYLEILVYGFIEFYISRENNGFYFSNKQIAEAIGKPGLSEATITRAIKKLEKVGLIKTEYIIKAKGGKVRIVRIDVFVNSEHAKKSVQNTQKSQINNIYKKNIYKNNNINTISEKEKQQLKEIVDYYNEVFEKNIRSTKGFEKNFYYWIKIHSIEEIKQAIRKARLDPFWSDKMTLTILFRRKNPRGEDVDYIEDLNNRDISKKPKYGVAKI